MRAGCEEDEETRRLLHRRGVQGGRDGLGVEENSPGEAAAAHGVTRATLYQRKRLLVGKEPIETRRTGLPDNPERLAYMVADLQEQVRKLQLRRDVLEETVELLGKGRGRRLEPIDQRGKDGAGGGA